MLKRLGLLTLTTLSLSALGKPTTEYYFGLVEVHGPGKGLISGDSLPLKAGIVFGRRVTNGSRQSELQVVQFPGKTAETKLFRLDLEEKTLESFTVGFEPKVTLTPRSSGKIRFSVKDKTYRFAYDLEVDNPLGRGVVEGIDRYRPAPGLFGITTATITREGENAAALRFVSKVAIIDEGRFRDLYRSYLGRAFEGEPTE